MQKVAVMTDTVSYMPDQIAKQHYITVIPTHVIFDGKSHFEDEIDLAWFYKQLPGWKESDSIPTTSSPSIDDFLGAYHRLSQQTDSIVYIAYSNKLGMAVSASSQAKTLIKDELLQTQIEVIDSQTACGAQTLVTLEAARAAAAGKSFSEVIKIAKDMVKKVSFVFISDDLYYLAKGGRIHRARPWAASKITNSVLLEMDARTDGQNTPLARCRTKGEALKTLFDLVKQRSDSRKLHVAINHADALAEAEELKEKVTASFQCSEVFINHIGPLVTTHVGVGSRMFCWWAEE
jgi:DegV family protein with EDD domain